MAEKSRDRQGSYMQSEDATVSTRSDERKGSAPGMSERNSGNIATDNAMINKRAQCDSLNSQIKAIRNQQRSGGVSRTMDELNKQKYDLESALRSADCNNL